MTLTGCLTASLIASMSDLPKEARWRLATAHHLPPAVQQPGLDPLHDYIAIGEQCATPGRKVIVAAIGMGAKLRNQFRHSLVTCEPLGSGSAGRGFSPGAGLGDQPRYIHEAVSQLRHYLVRLNEPATAILIAPYLSAASRELCIENGIGYLDFEGNAHIAFGSVFLERIGSDAPVTERREFNS